MPPIPPMKGTIETAIDGTEGPKGCHCNFLQFPGVAFRWDPTENRCRREQVAVVFYLPRKKTVLVGRSEGSSIVERCVSLNFCFFLRKREDEGKKDV